MTKQELYDELKNKGIPLKSIKNTTVSELEQLKANAVCLKTPTERKKEPVAANTPIPALRFTGGGWCDVLKKSYFAGIHQAKSWFEYEALKPFAIQEE